MGTKHLQLKQRRPWVWFPMVTLSFFHFQLAYTNVDGMTDLWCFSTVQRIYGALVQFGCYQHRYEWKGLWCSSVVWLLSTQMQGMCAPSHWRWKLLAFLFYTTTRSELASLAHSLYYCTMSCIWAMLWIISKVGLSGTNHEAVLNLHLLVVYFI